MSYTYKDNTDLIKQLSEISGQLLFLCPKGFAYV